MSIAKMLIYAVEMKYRATDATGNGLILIDVDRAFTMGATEGERELIVGH